MWAAWADRAKGTGRSVRSGCSGGAGITLAAWGWVEGYGPLGVGGAGTCLKFWGVEVEGGIGV